jgi:hypothetical protein
MTSLCILVTTLRSSRKAHPHPLPQLPPHPSFKDEYGGVYIPTISETVEEVNQRRNTNASDDDHEVIYIESPGIEDLSKVIKNSFEA